ncbi:MAG: hypothetical protein LCI00_19210 [Chloroflexi bacterium]|nr:hypothetical protein [Chloroflexota bacterium]MCC6894148.1 hypothetical protein [Anaerolineae bacterium]
MKRFVKALVILMFLCSCTVGIINYATYVIDYCQWSGARTSYSTSAHPYIPINTKTISSLETIYNVEATGGTSQPRLDVTFSPDGQLLIASGRVVSYDLSSSGGGPSSCGSLWGISLQNDGQSWSSDIAVFHTKYTGDTVTSVTFSENGEFIIVNQSRGAEVWKTNPFQLLYSLDTPHEPAVFIARGEMIAYQVKNEIRLIDTETQQPVSHFTKQTYKSGLAGDFNNLLATDDGNGTVQVWDATTGTTISEIASDINLPYSPMAFSLDSNLLAFGTDTGAYLWDFHNNSIKHLVKTKTGEIKFDAQGNYIAVRNGLSLALWNLNESRLIIEMNRSGGAFGIAFNHSGDLLASGWKDSLEFVDLSTGAVIKTVPNLRGSIRDLEFSPDDRFLAAAFLNGDVMIWGVPQNT